MKTFLMSWNPEKDTVTDVAELIKKFSTGYKVETKWSVTNSNRPMPNDRFYLMKVGNKGRGIFGSGVITSPPEAGRHYDPVKAKEGKKLKFVDIEFDFLVDSTKSNHISWDELKEINDLIGVKQNWTPEGSGNEIKPEVVPYLEKLWETFKEENTVISDVEYIEACKVLDKRVDVSVRPEQQFLRKKLFNFSRLSTCCICNSMMPIDFLVAAHIKKRAECDDKEKSDYKNIVSPMCKFGCDELYERGYIAVHDGQVTNLNKLKVGFGHDFIQGYLKKVTGQRCEIYSPKNSAYFEWHYDKHK